MFFDFRAPEENINFLKSGQMRSRIERLVDVVVGGDGSSGGGGGRKVYNSAAQMTTAAMTGLINNRSDCRGEKIVWKHLGSHGDRRLGRRN